MAIRDHIRHHGSKVALVLGGGLLGLEAAHSLRAAGLQTTVLDRNAWVMHRQADRECGLMLQAALADLGVQVRTSVNIAGVTGPGRVTSITLDNGETAQCDILLASTGIAPGLSLASDAGIETRRGILVDDHMSTSDARAFAAGDIAEHRGAVYGLWGASADQARVAAMNMAGANESYRGSITAAQLKVAGIEFTSFGEISGKQGDLTFCEADAAARKYRKLVVRDGKLVGAVLLGHAELAGELVEKARAGADVSRLAAALDRGDWRALAA
jgi:NAD(P)H-nitrite reductase large subunit